MKLTPIQESFSAGEISPLMFQRSSTEGYRQGVVEMTNMHPDSRGPAYSRSGSKYITEGVGNDARVFSMSLNDDFFYSAFFTDLFLTIGSLSGNNPNKAYNTDPSFTGGGFDWFTATDGDVNSTVTFTNQKAILNVENRSNRYVLVGQEVTVPAIGNYKIVWSTEGFLNLTLKVGTTLDDGSLVDQQINSYEGELIVNFTSTTQWITFRLDSQLFEARESLIDYFGVTDEVATTPTFITPYTESQVESLQAVQSPDNGSLYILHESHPPYKLTYDRATDSFTWGVVTFTSPPTEWVAGNYPSAGSFFEGRLWLGGTINQPQTFWGSKSALPEDFTQGSLADEGLTFTMAIFGRIVWMVGFKNLVIGTKNGEHITTSAGGFIKPDDIQVEQQSSYGSSNIQPVQVGDQIFYVSADRRKLRAIQYEWQKDNWLSKDLTFNSEHITKAGIKHIIWQQNPNNLFQCILNDGSIASLTYERSQNVYGWSKLTWDKGKVIDASTGALKGVDFINYVIQNKESVLNFEIQSQENETNYLDSWVERNPESDGITILGLDHLEGLEVQVLINDAIHPNRTVTGNQITLQQVYNTNDKVVIGLKNTSRLITLPFDQGAPAGSGASWMKRWNKIYIRVNASAKPLINGERSPERHPQTPMNTPEPLQSVEIVKINLGHDLHAITTIEQDLPKQLTVLGIFGELGQSVT